MNEVTPSPARSRRATLVSAAAALIAVALFGLWYHRRAADAAKSFAPRGTLDLTEPGASAEPPTGVDDRELRVAIAPVISPERNLELYQELVTYLGRSVGRKPRFIRRRSYAEVNDVVRAGQCDVALVCTYAFVRGEREFGMRLLAIPQVAGERTYQGLVIVPQSSPARSLVDLEGKHFAFVDLMSTSGFLYPKTALLQAGREPDHFFARETFSGSHDRSIFAVRDGLVDGAAVDGIVFRGLVAREPRLASQARVIERSERYGMPPLVVPAAIEPALESRLRHVLLGMREDPEGAPILDQLHIDRFVPADERDYDSVRRIVKVWEDR